jgi:hypothetical protein
MRVTERARRRAGRPAQQGEAGEHQQRPRPHRDEPSAPCDQFAPDHRDHPDGHECVHRLHVGQEQPTAEHHARGESPDCSPTFDLEQATHLPAGDERDHSRQRNVVQCL